MTDQVLVIENIKDTLKEISFCLENEALEESLAFSICKKYSHDLILSGDLKEISIW